MYLGGLKSLFADMHDMIENIEKTGNMPGSMLNNLVDVKEAIDLTLQQLKRATVQCCEHDDHCDEYNDEEELCEDCELSLTDCVCSMEDEDDDEEDEDDDEEEVPESQPKAVTRKPVKKATFVANAPPAPVYKKNKKETKH